MPEIEKIQSESFVRHFTFNKTDSFYLNKRTNSRLYLRGVNEDRGDSARGSFAHGITADELGTWRDPDYILKEVLMPQLLTTGGPLHKLSTPPEDLGHPWYRYKAEAMRDGRFIQKTIFDNKSLSEKDIEEMCNAVGGPNSPAWRREFLCEPVANPERLIVPEYDEARHDYDYDFRPAYYDAYVGADLGFHDHTGMVFGYHDFERRTLMIENELWLHGKNSREITWEAKQIEQALWKHVKPYKRVSDNEIQQLHDMATMFDYQMHPTAKDDKHAAINALRLRFTQGRIRIHKRCKQLRYQLKVGLWNEQKSSFLRGETTGHLDLIDALIYLNRNIAENHNPFPVQTPGHGMHVNPYFDKNENNGETVSLIPDFQKFF